MAEAPTVARRLPIVDAVAPAERLAMFRILVGTFTVLYLAIRSPVFLQLADRSSGFDGVGLAALLDGPVAGSVIPVVLVITVVAGIGFTAGAAFRITGPALALGMLALGSYRGSWGQLLHFENLFVLHLLILALAPAADAWSLDARRHRRRSSPIAGADSPEMPETTAYGWPLALAAVVTVVTYVIAGIAKLRYGGLDWIVGDTIRNHVAYAAARLDLLGATPSPLAGWAVRHDALWSVAAAAAVVIELAAPVALLGGRVRTVWVALVWLMHVGILASMLILFPYPLFLVAFAPLYRVERLWLDRPTWLGRETVGQRTV